MGSIRKLHMAATALFRFAAAAPAGAVMLAASTIGAFADDPRPFIGEEFPMKGIACSNVPDAQRLGATLIRGQVRRDEEIVNTIAANKLECKFIDQAAIYTGPVARSEFMVTGRFFIIDEYVPADGVASIYVWRRVRSIVAGRDA